jgi:hypothetical protein
LIVVSAPPGFEGIEYPLDECSMVGMWVRERQGEERQGEELSHFPWFIFYWKGEARKVM